MTYSKGELKAALHLWIAEERFWLNEELQLIDQGQQPLEVSS